jgi:hypothetical protein
MNFIEITGSEETVSALEKGKIIPSIRMQVQ